VLCLGPIGTAAWGSAIKLAIQYYQIKQNPEPERTVFIARRKSYHGTSIPAISGSGHDARRDPYKPVLSTNFRFISACDPYYDKNSDESDEAYVTRLASELEQTICEVHQGPERVAAFVMEPAVGAVSLFIFKLLADSTLTVVPRL
jgi:adenosylmethionine-8-amino-7-oxononanoate aminotransferase